jgi:mono/diheme cytochrome c family protein
MKLKQHGITALLLASIPIGAAQYPGWLIPSGGRDEKSPLSSVADAATRGKAIYVSNCAKCHGIELRACESSDEPGAGSG